MDKVKFNPLTEIITEDFNNLGNYTENALQNLITDFLQAGGVVTGLAVKSQAVPDMTVYYEVGRLYQAGSTGSQESNSIPYVIGAAPASGKRIDRLCVQYSVIEDIAETRNAITDVNTRQTTQQVIKTRVHGGITALIVAGVPGANPAPPAIPNGYISLAQIAVNSGAVTIQQTDITDERPTIKSLITHAHAGGQDGAKIDFSNIKNIPNFATASGLTSLSAALAAYFDDSTGHRHTAGAGDGPQLRASDIVNTLIPGLNTNDVQSTLGAVYSEAIKKGTSAARNTVVSGPYSAKGAALLLRDRYSENLCVGGAAISGGDYTGFPAPKEYAFDGSMGSGWASVQLQSAVSGVAYIGYNFVTAKHIRKIVIKQIGAANFITSAKIQYSANGTAWSDATTVNMYFGTNIIELISTGAYQYWRVLANSNIAATNNYWAVNEVEMYELLDASLGLNDLVIQAGGLINFAAGQSQSGNVDYPYYVAANATLAGLPSADAQTIPLAYTEDLCNGGTPISGGDYVGYPAAQVFDNNWSTGWASAQAASNQLGAAYIGYNFGVVKRIRKVQITTHNSSGNNMPIIKVQYSTNGSSWTDVTTISYDPVKVNQGVDISLPDVGGAQYWRLLAGANLSNSYAWIIPEIEMYEALQTYYIHVTREADGSVTYGYTRQKPKQGKPSQSVITSQGTYSADLCTGGTAISNGDYAGQAKERAFDDNDATAWQSSQLGASANTYAAIGYILPIAKTVRRIRLSTSPEQNCKIVQIQYSVDGVGWNTLPTVNTGNNLTPIIDIPDVGAWRYWRLASFSNVTNSSGTTVNSAWYVSEIELMEYIPPVVTVSTDDLIYTDNVAVGVAAISIGDYPGLPKENAFDGNLSTSWSSPTGTVFTTRYIGCDFGVARKIKKVVISYGRFPASVKVQYATDGAAWNDACTVALSGNNGVAIAIISGEYTARYWRIIGNSSTLTDGLTDYANYSISVAEITMHEICTDLTHYDQYTGQSRYYNGTTWINVVRKFLGEVVVDSAGKIVNYTTYPYGLTNIVASPAQGTDDVVTLGQFKFFGNTTTGAMLFPGGLLLQWGFVNGVTGTPGVFYTAFPHSVGPIIPAIAYGGAYAVAQPGVSTLTGFTMWHNYAGTAQIGYIAIGY